MTQEAQGEVYDLGYQHYDGPREGRLRSHKALWSNTVRSALGVGRGTSALLFPIFLIVGTLGPAVIIVIANVAAGPLDINLPGHAEYYRFVLLFLLLFSAIVAPEILCPDRRDRVLSLYLVRPMSATDYILARWLAFFVLMVAVVIAGQTVLFGGLVLGADDPVEYLRNNWLDVPRFVASGALIALLTATVPLAISAFTTRRALAAATILGLFLLSAAFAEGLTECEDHRGTDECEPVTGEYAGWFALIGIAQTPMYVNNQIFGIADANPGNPLHDLHGAVPIGWFGLVVGVSGLAMWRQYQRVGL